MPAISPPLFLRRVRRDAQILEESAREASLCCEQLDWDTSTAGGCCLWSTYEWEFALGPSKIQPLGKPLSARKPHEQDLLLAMVCCSHRNFLVTVGNHSEDLAPSALAGETCGECSISPHFREFRHSEMLFVKKAGMFSCHRSSVMVWKIRLQTSFWSFEYSFHFDLTFEIISACASWLAHLISSVSSSGCFVCASSLILFFV